MPNTQKKLNDWIFKNCKWWDRYSSNESFIYINIPLDKAFLDSKHGKKFHNKDENTKHYHWYYPRLGSWKHAEKRIFNDFKKGIIKIKEIQCLN